MPRLLRVRKKARVPATCCAKRRPRQPVEQVADAAVVGADPAGRLAVGAGLDLQPRRQCGIVREPERLDAAGREQHARCRAPAHRRDDRAPRPRSRPGSGGGVRRTASRSSRPRPRASFPSARPARPRGDGRAPRQATRADPVDLGREGEAGADRVDMRVDQSRNDGAARKIDHAGRRAGERADVGRASDRDDPVAAHRERLGRSGVERDDLAVEEDRVGGLRLRGSGEQREQAGPARQPAQHDCYSRCSVQLVSMFISVEPGGLRRATFTCL